jgi:hypothetical protein
MPRTKRHYTDKVWSDDKDWVVRAGELRPVRRNAQKANHLFKYVGEKLPWDALNEVSGYLKKHKVKRDGVYMAHDSFGVARYGGRGHIFSRLRNHKKKYFKELEPISKLLTAVDPI